MADIQKPDMAKTWANAGDKTPPADSLINTGWNSGDIPTNTDFNFIDARQDQGVAYMLQKGIPEWDNATEYQANKSMVQYGGSIYKCRVTNTNFLPTDQTKWALLLQDASYICTPELYGKRIEIVAGTLRQNTTDRTKWDFISDTSHTPLGVSGISGVAAGSELTVTYGKTYSKVIHLSATPDETFANGFGMSVGSSVGTSSSVFKASISQTLAGQLYYDGSTWQLSYGVGQGGTVEPNINISGTSYVSGTLNVAHDYIQGLDISLVADTRVGAILNPYIPCKKSVSDNAFAVHFLNPTTGNVVTAASPDTRMTFNFAKRWRGGIRLDGTSSSDSFNLNLGNIWFFGIFEV